MEQGFIWNHLESDSLPFFVNDITLMITFPFTVQSQVMTMRNGEIPWGGFLP